jgi:type III secretion protein T
MPATTAVQAQLDIWFNQLLPLLAALPRALALMLTIPLFPQQPFGLLIRNAIALSLLLAVYPMLAAQAPPLTWSVFEWVGFAAKEAFIGFLLGYALGTLFWVFQSVGDLIDNQVGMNNANIFDPFGGHSGGPYSSFLMQTSVVIFVVLGGLHLVSAMLYESHTLWPMRTFVPRLGAGYEALAREGLQFKGAWTMTLVAPIVIILVLAELGVGLINRVAQQLNAFYFAMPIKGVIAALMVALLMSFWVDSIKTFYAGLRGLLPAWDAVLR